MYVTTQQNNYCTCYYIASPSLDLSPKIQIMNPKVVHVDLEENVTLTCNATGDNIKYEWKNGSGSFDDGKVSGVNTNSLVITRIRLSDNSTYICMASNKRENVSSNITLIVTGMTMCFDS